MVGLTSSQLLPIFFYLLATSPLALGIPNAQPVRPVTHRGQNGILSQTEQDGGFQCRSSAGPIANLLKGHSVRSSAVSWSGCSALYRDNPNCLSYTFLQDSSECLCFKVPSENAFKATPLPAKEKRPSLNEKADITVYDFSNGWCKMSGTRPQVERLSVSDCLRRKC
ncbi:MAG: hypothetical protein M1829_006419 [Trizodia sp. TS-e1964]|nr:MAG: hypothetical protein M1829_006419 [Trizodia sp. TS-e1964]